jgi:hypothetical protein
MPKLKRRGFLATTGAALGVRGIAPAGTHGKWTPHPDPRL